VHKLPFLLGSGLLWSLALPGCRSVEVASENLDSLHGPGGRHRYSAELTSPWRQTVAKVQGSLMAEAQPASSAKVRKRVRNPSGRILEELLDLASFEPSSPSVQASQVRAYAWLGLVDPSVLVRERSFLELRGHVQRLQLEAPPEVLDPEEVVDPAELLHLVRGLYDSAAPVLEKGEAMTPTERADLEATLELIGERSYDEEGGRRLLEALANLFDGRDPERPELAPLLELSDQLQADLVGQALAGGLRDEAPSVRAAAFRTAHAAYGDAFLAEALVCLDAGTRLQGLDRFGLLRPRPEDEEVFMATFELVAEHGLPSGDPWGVGMGEGPAGIRRLTLELVVLRIALDYTVYGDRARTAALLALLAIEPEGPRTLRAEDWQVWWMQTSRPRLERFQQLSEAAQGEGVLPPAPPAEGAP